MENIRECPDCASTNIVQSTERDQLICRECGLIQPLLPEISTTKPVRKKAKKTVKKKKRK
jgi:transcription initiation factor TFIIIB Brf1 subunit/transcription initiation factor TFIIB